MDNYTQYINALRACAKEHKYDQTPFSYIMVSKLCDDVADLLEKLEQEPLVLDKIQADIKQYIDKEKLSFGGQFDSGLNFALKIIDKYKTNTKGEEV